MEKVVSATDVVRQFSEILNSIKYKGDCYTVVRGRKAVAFICPIEKGPKGKSLGELRELLKNLPPLGSEVERFQEDLKAIMKNQPSLPKGNRWA
jgi:hypothetical protein